ncbi:radical SAM protein [Geoalkalibacter sp.]|uniref:radical SAM protein n=1 Tax=Geoalkalibacter sp. TaxID=3041440 RepID=UPI00272DDD1C|nr:radical SAM protein [Geoalkalibacter sp.]
MSPDVIPPEALFRLLGEEGLSPPRILTLAITGVCNLHCRHCWVEGGAEASAAHVATANLRRLLREFAELGGAGVRLTGGEPLCHPDWFSLLRCARDLDFPQLALQTNAELLRNDTAEALASLDFPGLSIQVSLDGATAASHDLVRGTGAFAGALAGLKRLVAVGLAPRLSLFLTEMRHNFDEIPALLELAEELGIPELTSGALVRCGRAARDERIAPPTATQYLGLLDRYDTDEAFRNRYRARGKIAALEWRGESRARTQDCSFVENPYLSAAGTLYPCLLCHADSHAATEVFAKPLAAAFAEGARPWSALRQLSRERAASIPECRACAHRASCGAGCMGRAWGGCGDFFVPEDRCALRRAVYARKKTNADPG